MVDEQAEALRTQHRGQRLHTVDRDALGELRQHFPHTAADPVVVTGCVLAQFRCTRTNFGGEEKFTTGHRDHRAGVKFRD